MMGAKFKLSLGKFILLDSPHLGALIFSNQQNFQAKVIIHNSSLLNVATLLNLNLKTTQCAKKMKGK